MINTTPSWCMERDAHDRKGNVRKQIKKIKIGQATQTVADGGSDWCK